MKEEWDGRGTSHMKLIFFLNFPLSSFPFFIIIIIIFIGSFVYINNTDNG